MSESTKSVKIRSTSIEKKTHKMDEKRSNAF